ncbi:MAG: choline kinase [Myxococcota bacterium]
MERLQSLWSGWGEIARYALVNGPVPTVIVKVVEPPAQGHPRGWDSDRSQARKHRSYEVEASFYTTFAPRVEARVARAWSIEPGCFVLEDLDAAGFPKRAKGPGSLGSDAIAACLDWLAVFHRAFEGQSPEGLWPIGTYRHLETRPDEWQGMDEGPLKAAAGHLDRRLAGVPLTLVHGDAKVANFCFGAAGVAAVDFQYVGGGCGLKDVAYFLGSCLDEEALFRDADLWLDHYFARLERPHLEAAWRPVWPHAWADFERFMAGWAPDHWKRSRFVAEMTRLALQSLDAEDGVPAER